MQVVVTSDSPQRLSKYIFRRRRKLAMHLPLVGALSRTTYLPTYQSQRSQPVFKPGAQ